MKRIRMFLMILSLFIIAGMGGCEDNEVNELKQEISFEKGSNSIQQVVDGIELNFCLLNENNEPTTVLNYKENITFSLTIKNNFKNEVSILTDFIDSNFYRVFKIDTNEDMGKPWTGLWCEYSLSDKKLDIARSEIYQLNCPWQLTENNQPDYPICMAESMEFLPAGDYYTFIKLHLRYNIEEKSKIINNVLFKINFRIKHV